MAESADRYARVPEEMKALKQWVIWGVNEEKPKSPYNPQSSSVGAKANDPGTWAGFAAAAAAAARLGRGGIGFEFGAPGGIAGLDLDHVINDKGELAQWAAEIVALMDSYTELSPSGRGLHIIFKLSVPYSEICPRNKDSKQGIEIYDTGRYFTVTGKPYGEAKPIADRTEQVRQVCARYLAKTETAKPKAERRESTEMSNAELWERMFEAPNGAGIRALYNGDVSGYTSLHNDGETYADKSAADMALCNHLAYWTENDAGRMDAMFRESGLMRDKWDELRGSQTYGELTIAEAIRSTSTYTPTYTPPARSGGNAPTERRGAVQTLSPYVEATNIAQLKPVSDYLEDFVQELLKSREGQAIPTGFAELDALLDGGLYPGLYFLGAISSLGKTTLALQIADNIAKGGHGVLIFSLEMSRTEMMAKTLSRESLMIDIAENGMTANALSTRGVLRASFSGKPEQEEVMRKAIEGYASWGRNLTIVEGIGDVGTEQIKSYVEAYMSEHEGKPPVVVIDYLQILSPVDIRATDKQNVDKNVLELKRLSRDYQLPIIGISSFNRESYNVPVSMASFKESGAIEYSSDVLIGMQILGIERAEDETLEKYKERVQTLLKDVSQHKKLGQPIYIEMKILKHRNGVPGEIDLEFHSRCNYFRELRSD